MRIYLTAAIALALLAGCSSEQDSPSGKAAGIAASGAQALPGGPFASPGLRAASSSFASLPDRGELLAYDAVRKPRQSGAYTAYPVAISEAHALDAMRSGEMVVEAPNGELVRLKYERHEETPDGNWTWIGRDANGADAVITFGGKAVFGVIPQGDETLRLTMSAGQSYLVQADRSRLAGLDGMKRRNGGDQPVPPKLSAAAGLPSVAAMQAQSATTAAAGAASTVVDVLIGYTNGLASQLGSDSAAVTRVNNMVAITNQAYSNSGVTMRVRLVKAMKVNYADNTDNGDALEKLTGYRSGDDDSDGGPIDPDPAFKDLRQAREDTGADLVSLVRAFRTPENNGCGIAWLLGGGGSGIGAGDAPYGYSVVSDGTDKDEDDGNTYYCREETLAHELGHNMGQAHNEEDSDGSGVHSYSYGYRESSSTGFYTVMAYPLADGDQHSIRYFANPSVKDAASGRVTGTADKSDNVRSMNQTMPIVSTFRATIVPAPQGARYDFNGDGYSDVLWRSSAGVNVYWKSANFATRQTVTTLANQAWKVVGVGDFNGDRKADILWRNSTTGENSIWLSADSKTIQGVTAVSGQTWQVVGVDDFNGDGKADILWRNSASGANTIWLSGKSASVQAVTTVGAQAWKVVGTGDFNGDGKADIVWRNSTSGANSIWLSGKSSTLQAVTTVGVQAWKVAGTGDFDGDGKSDLLWRNSSTGANAIWLSGDSKTLKSIIAVTSQAWRVVAVGDYNNDGQADILWRNFTSGANTIWLGASSALVRNVTSVTDLGWHVVP